MVVAQLAERLLLTPEIRGLNSNIGNKVFGTLVLFCQLQLRRDENKEN